MPKRPSTPKASGTEAVNVNDGLPPFAPPAACLLRHDVTAGEYLLHTISHRTSSYYVHSSITEATALLAKDIHTYLLYLDIVTSFVQNSLAFENKSRGRDPAA
jgi:hypothetical protein